MWVEVNKLSLNIGKTNFIIFKSPLHSSPETVCIKVGKFLGVLLEENLSWKYHLPQLSKNLLELAACFSK